ncbi:MAG: hypothetical protein AB2602_16020, partial [Candidatus Thiodiazotropha sp.]
HKRGSIPSNQPPILNRLQIDPQHWLYMTQHWLYMTQHFESRFKGIVGTSYKLKEACQRMGYQRTPNLSAAIHYLS